MSKYRNVKIAIESPEHSEYVQNKFFEDGCRWSSLGKVVQLTDNPYLFVNAVGEITYSKYKQTFLEEKAKEITMPMTFTKSDFKSGMVVKFLNGNQAVLIGDKFINRGWHTDDFLMNFTEDFKHIFNSGYDIEVVYNILEGSVKVFPEDDSWSEPKILWSRKDQEQNQKEKERNKKIAEIESKQRELADELSKLKSE